MKIKDYLEGIGFWSLIGIVLDIVGFLLISFTLWEFIEIDWVVARGVVAGTTLLGMIVGLLVFTEENRRKLATAE